MLIWNFLISSKSAGLATLIAGSIALIIYFFQKKDKKTSAARIILSEIRLAEQKEVYVKTLFEQNVKGYPTVLPVNSWEKYSYLFASDFDQDQLDEISNFYSNCKQIDEASNRDNNYFWLSAEYIAKSGQDKAADLLIASVNSDSSELSLDTKKLEKLRDSILGNFDKYSYLYAPQKSLNMLNSSLSKFQKLSTTPTGLKLKQLAGLSKYKLIFKILSFEVKF